MKTTTELLTAHNLFVSRGLRAQVLSVVPGASRIERQADEMTGVDGKTIYPGVLLGLAYHAAELALNEAAPAGARWTLSEVRVAFHGPAMHNVLVAADATSVDWASAVKQQMNVIFQDVRGDLVATASMGVERD